MTKKNKWRLDKETRDALIFSNWLLKARYVNRIVWRDGLIRYGKKGGGYIEFRNKRTSKKLFKKYAHHGR